MNKLTNELNSLFQALNTISVRGVDVKTLSNVLNYIENMIQTDYQEIFEKEKKNHNEE